MKPYYQDESVTLYHGRCEDVLPTIPLESVDALVTDPPFGLGKVYAGDKEAANTPAAYWEWLAPIYQASLATVRPGGFVAVWQAQPYFRHFWDWFGDAIHIYAACKNFVQIRPTPINYGYDPVVMLYRPGADPLCRRKGDGGPFRNIDYFVANTASAVSDPSRLERGHPFPRPLDQVREILEGFVIPGGTVLDPFAGSGTALLAARLTGRRAIGVEVQEHFCEIIARRLTGYRSDGQGDLLAGLEAA